MESSIWRQWISWLSPIVVLSALGASGAEHSVPKPVPDPSQGDGGVSAFHVWDKEVPGTPGQLLRQEQLPENLELGNASKGIRVLYTSTNGIDGKTSIAVSGAVYFPKGSAPTGGWPTIAWAHGTVLRPQRSQRYIVSQGMAWGPRTNECIT